MFERVDAIREWIDQGKMPERRRHGGDRVHGAGKEQHGHDEEVHDDIEPVKGREPRGDQDAERCNAERDEQGHGNDLDELQNGDVDAEERNEDQDDYRLGH